MRSRAGCATREGQGEGASGSARAVATPHPDTFDKLRTGFPRKGGRNLNVEHKVRKPSGAFKLRPMDLSTPAKGLMNQAPTNLAAPAQ